MSCDIWCKQVTSLFYEFLFLCEVVKLHSNKKWLYHTNICQALVPKFADRNMKTWIIEWSKLFSSWTSWIKHSQNLSIPGCNFWYWQQMSAVVCYNVCTHFNTVFYTLAWFFQGFSNETPQKPDLKGTRTYVRSGSGPVRSGSGKYQSGPGPGPFNTNLNNVSVSGTM